MPEQVWIIYEDTRRTREEFPGGRDNGIPVLVGAYTNRAVAESHARALREKHNGGYYVIHQWVDGNGPGRGYFRVQEVLGKPQPSDLRAEG